MYILDNIMRRTLDIRQRRCKRRLRVEKDKKKKDTTGAYLFMYNIIIKYNIHQ